MKEQRTKILTYIYISQFLMGFSIGIAERFFGLENIIGGSYINFLKIVFLTIAIVSLVVERLWVYFSNRTNA